MKISDDYLDELCRRAAELYPLKLKPVNWSWFNQTRSKFVSSYKVIRFVSRKLGKH